MEKIIKFCKEKYKILIPIMVVLVLLITVYFLYKEYKYDSYRNKQEVSVYQCFNGVKTEYTAIITYNLRKNIVSIEGKDKNINYDSTPVYYQEEDRVLFPQEMSIVFPDSATKQYRLHKYTNYYELDNQYVLSNDNKQGRYNNFFIFDNEGLYFFSDEVTIKIDGKEYVKLGANSFAEVVGGYTLSYYDKKTGKSELLEVEGKKVTAVNDYLDLNLNDRYFMLHNKKILLVPSYNLEALLTD